jgi:3-oxoacyl-[acyl-carrier-protein] synthase II
MADAVNEALITGIGIVSCLGEGADAHWQALTSPNPRADLKTFAPYVVHPVVTLNLDSQIPKKGDQRQMEAWQRIGTYAAGLALHSAGLKGNTEVLSRMDMIVAAGGGERDLAVDSTIMSGLSKAADRNAFLNEQLMSGLRPTLFLAQLSNLLAGNISIVHGVTGSSRTFMGEEAAGVDAVRIAQARIAAGQSDIAIIGGSYNAERQDLILLYDAGGHMLKGDFAPVFDRASRGGGMALGSMGAFLVLESANHARQRGARPLARISSVMSDRSNRPAGAVIGAMKGMWQRLAPKLQPGAHAVISGATGAEPGTAEERAWLESLDGVPVRATGTHMGHGLEPQFVMNIALATLALGHQKLFPPADSSGIERASSEMLKQVVVTSVGHWRGEGMALVEAAS